MVDLEDLAGVAGAGPNAQVPKDFDAEKAPNAEEIEQQFAVVCFEQAEAYFNLITSIKPSTLSRLTKWDDEIIEAFTAAFPELVNDDEKLRVLNEEEMKSPEGKKRWREFMMPFDGKVNDYNFGTLIRSNCEDDYTQENSIFGLRVQFYAIEILRNRRGLNDAVYEKAQAEKKAKASS
ncbi:DUF757 domain-containing protein [Meredithblackwellia eburnea MCA 4105]